MFKYKYYITLVDAEKDLYNITPHWSVWIKAFAPVAILTVGMTAVGMVLQATEKREESLTEDSTLHFD